VLAKLMVAPSIRLPRGLKLGLEIGSVLREVGGEMVALVAINGAFGESVLSRNISERLSRFEPVIDGSTGRMDADGANTRH
jgi:hypothetical protein